MAKGGFRGMPGGMNQAQMMKQAAVDPDDVEMLQDMIMAAVNEAMRTADADAAQNMSRLTGGMNLGGLF